MTTFDASYDCSDDKLRIRASSRLDAETYARVKASGFSWAPKQDLFYAVWTPAREDLAIELAGDIEDESTSLEDRAAQRAERFSEYESHRARDAEQARKAVSAIADNIPLGQPILVGHHSERHARRDAERIENGMRKAVQLWETKEYWQGRAAASLAHAERHEVPAVRARRVKTLEAAQRKAQRDLAESEARADSWRRLSDPNSLKRKDGTLLTFAERVMFLARIGAGCSYDLQRKLECGELTPEAAQASVISGHEASATHERRWISHLENRLVYERALLAESGYAPPPKPKSKADLPILNYAGRVSYRNRFSRETVECDAAPLTKAEYSKIGTDYKGTVVSSCGTHRLRTALLRDHAYHVIVLTDSKQHPRPDAATVAAQGEEDEVARDILLARKTEQMQARIEANRAAAPEREKAAEEAAPFKAIKTALKAGVQVVVAPQLFPTPPELAARMVEAADLKPGLCVLEPSAGTGNIVQAVLDAVDTEVLAYEINRDVASALARKFPSYKLQVRCNDFLKVTDFQGQYPRILMNPPFSNGQDVAHIKHAIEFLAAPGFDGPQGGRLVAICANGPRQQAELRPLATTWEELPEGTFAEAGTNVRTVLMTVQR